MTPLSAEEGGALPGRLRGASVAETLLALLLGLLLVHLVLDTVASVRAGVASLSTRSDRLAAVRTLREVVGGDGRQAGRSLVVSPGGDSLALAVVRGGVVGCGGAAGVWTVRWEGVRAPDPGKDSLRVVGADGRVSLHALVEAGPPRTTCPAGLGGAPAGLVLDPPAPPDALFGRYFEKGSYHLAGSAVRYRRGAGGRQPLTAEVVGTPDSRFSATGGGVRAQLVFPRRGVGGGGAAPGRGPWIVPVGPGGSGG